MAEKKTFLGLTGNAGLGVIRKPLPLRSPKSKYRKIKNIPMHRLIVEQRTGLKLKSHQEVHHVDPDDKFTNAGLFVVCENAEYHKLLEIRGRALRACGNPNYRKCYRCGKWDAPKNMFRRTRKTREGAPDDGMSEMLHAKINGVCVDMPEPIAEGAWTCHAGPGGRHGIASRKQKRQKGVPTFSGLEQTCAYCGGPIRRMHKKTVRWYAVSKQIVTAQFIQRGPSVEGK